MKTQPQAIFPETVVMLAGGLGTRLRLVVSDKPKVLAEVAGRPFLDMLVENIRKAGVQRVVLSVGYMKDQIKARYANQDVFFAEEETPLGTGGGLKNAKDHIVGEHVLVMNADSWFSRPIDLAAFYRLHLSKNALLTILLAHPRKDQDYGVVLMGRDSKIQGFHEKDKNAPGEHLMSAGVYLMDRRIFDRMPDGPFSLENDFFSKLVGDAFYGFPIDADAELIDIGTPERYSSAQKIFES